MKRDESVFVSEPSALTIDFFFPKIVMEIPVKPIEPAV
jgi:hypothetical protein